MSPTPPPNPSRLDSIPALLGTLASAVLTGQAVSSLLGRATELLRSTLSLDHCWLLELRADASWVVRTRSRALAPDLSVEDLAPLARLALAATDPLRIDLTKEPQLAASPTLRALDAKVAVASVLAHGGYRYGVLLGLGTREGPLSEEEGGVAGTIALLLACAISQQSATGRLAMNAAVEDLLVHVGDFPEALRLVHAAVAQAVNVAQTELWQANPQTPTTLVRRCAFRSVGNTLQPFDSPAIGIESTVLTTLADDPRARWFSVDQAEPAVRQWLQMKRATDPELQSVLLLPLDRGTQARPSVLGVFHVYEQPFLSPDWLADLERTGRRIGERVRRTQAAQRLRSTLDDAPIGIADRSLDGRWLRVNEQLCKITGYRTEELVGKPVTAILHPEDAANEATLFDAVRRGDIDQYTVEKRYLRKDGSTTWVSITSSAVREDDGETSYCVIVVQDINARRAAEAQLRESEERFRRVLVASPVPLMVYNEVGQVVALSESWTEVTGYRHQDIPTIAAWCERAFADKAQAMLDRLDATWRAGSVPLNSEVSIQVKTGERRELLVNSVPLGQDSHGLRLRLAAAADVTSLRRSERELLSANQQKDDFIAMLGHELRNPLSAMKHAAHVLRDHHPSNDPKDATEPVQRALGALDRHSQHMAKLLDGLLDISRVVRGKIALDERELDLAAIVRDVIEDLARTRAAEGLDINTHISGAPLFVKGDSVRLTQVVDNLLSNAIKYTSAPGTVSIRLSRDGGDAMLQVHDTGEGIDAELMPYLFEPFRQGRQALDRAHGGLGIGLSLVRALVELHQGTIEASSPGAGQGSLFTVRLPATRVDTVHDTEAPATAPSRRIVIIDDNEDAAEMLRFLLKRRGHDVSVAHHGQAGLELIEAFNPDVVLCDIGLPHGLSGFDVAEALRRNPAHQHLRLIALTGYGQAADIEHSRAVGFDAHLTKPASLSEIEDLL